MVADSCAARTTSDYSLALGKCANLADPAARRQCEMQAAADRRDATKTCADQRDARQAVCTKLGGGPYDPANPYLPFVPGTTFFYEGSSAEGLVHIEVAVSHNTKVILGVTGIEVHDTVTLNGELIEDTLDWFAQDRDGNVWYFGENAEQIAGGRVVRPEGSWTAGIAGAKPGIVMKAKPAVGDVYRQEFSLATAEDVAEVLDHCLKTRDSTPLEPGALENKLYCPGVGNVSSRDLAAGGEKVELVRVTTE